VVTSLSAEEIDARTLYEDVYCARGEMENRIKEQMELFADRTSTATMRANQLRLWFSTLAYVLMNEVRRVGLAGTKMAQAQWLHDPHAAVEDRRSGENQRASGPGLAQFLVSAHRTCLPRPYATSALRIRCAAEKFEPEKITGPTPRRGRGLSATRKTRRNRPPKRQI